MPRQLDSTRMGNGQGANSVTASTAVRPVEKALDKPEAKFAVNLVVWTERAEEATGWLVITHLGIVLAPFFVFMDETVLWLLWAILLSEGALKLLRNWSDVLGDIACKKVPRHWSTLINAVAWSLRLRLAFLTVQTALYIPYWYCVLRQRGHDRDIYDKDDFATRWEPRLYELLISSCVLVTFHFLVGLLAVVSSHRMSYMCFRDALPFHHIFPIPFYHLIRQEHEHVKASPASKASLAWYVHQRRHPFLVGTAAEDTDGCGLPTAWFLDVDQILDFIQEANTSENAADAERLALQAIVSVPEEASASSGPMGRAHTWDLLQAWELLRSVLLQGPPTCHAAALAAMASLLSRSTMELCELDLSNCHNFAELPGLQALTSLTTVKLSGCAALRALPPLKGLQSLTDLDVESCGGLVELDMLLVTSLQRLNFKYCRHLKALVLNGCSSLTSIPTLEGLINLEKMELDSCTSLRELPDLRHLVYLQFLDLHLCSQLTSLALPQTLVELRRVDLRECSSLSSLSMAAGLRELQQLDLAECRHLATLDLPAGLTELRHLDVRWCSRLTAISGHSGMTALTQLDLRGCNQLRRLKLVSCSGLLNLHIARSVARLEDLDLKACPSLTPFKSFSSLRMLARLRLVGCTGFSTLPSLAGLHRLTLLDLSGCTGLEDVPQLPPHIARISLCQCIRLTALPDLRGFAALEVLDVRGCFRLERHQPILVAPGVKLRTGKPTGPRAGEPPGGASWGSHAFHEQPSLHAEEHEFSGPLSPGGSRSERKAQLPPPVEEPDHQIGWGALRQMQRAAKIINDERDAPPSERRGRFAQLISEAEEKGEDGDPAAAAALEREQSALYPSGAAPTTMPERASAEPGEGGGASLENGSSSSFRPSRDGHLEEASEQAGAASADGLEGGTMVPENQADDDDSGLSDSDGEEDVPDERDGYGRGEDALR